jgi:hypothetical protein
LRNPFHPGRNYITAGFIAVATTGLLAACTTSDPAGDGGADGTQTFCETLQANEALFAEVLALGDTGGLLDSDLSTPHATPEEMAAAVPTFTNLYNAATVLLETAPDVVEQPVESLQFAADDAVFRLPEGDPSYHVGDAATAIKAINEWTVANCAA